MYYKFYFCFPLQALIEAHDSFKVSLSAAQADFNQLAALDKQIKSSNVGDNPYTWFVMENLEETWRNLQKIIKVLGLILILKSICRIYFLRYL